MAQTGFPHLPPGVPIYQSQYPPQPGMEPGPSSHPRGPPSLAGMGGPGGPPPSQHSNGDGPGSDQDGDKPKSASGRRTGRSATMTNDEWARQRKDNHVGPPCFMS